MNPLDIASALLLLAGAGFYLAGTVGLRRFPDVYCRLHALTKADHLGLGLIAAGLALQADNLWVATKLMLVWVLAMVASAAVSYAIAHRAHQQNMTPWQAPAAKQDPAP